VLIVFTTVTVSRKTPKDKASLVEADELSSVLSIRIALRAPRGAIGHMDSRGTRGGVV